MCINSSQQIETSSLTQVLHHLFVVASAIQEQQQAFLKTENPVFLYPNQTTFVHVPLRQIVAVKFQFQQRV